MAVHIPVIGGILGGLAARRVIAGIVTGVAHLFKTRLGLFIATAMLWLGINFGTMKMVVEPALDLLYGFVNGGGGAGGQFGAAAMQWMGVMNLDRAVTMIGSAVLIKKAMLSGRLFLFKQGYGAKP